MLVSHEPPRGRTGFSDWLGKNGSALGSRYASERDRHFRDIDLAKTQT